MRFQEYEAPRLTLGVVGLVAAIIPILLGYFLVSGMATNTSYSFPGGATSTTATTATSTGSGSTVAISIPTGSGSPSGAPGYAPDKVTVVIGVNATVTWSNDDTAAHTVTADNLTAGVAVFDSGNMPAGQTFTYNFTQPGTYTYHCDYHSWMTGTVVVKAGSGSSGIKVSIPTGSGSPSGAPGYAPDKVTVVIGVNATVTWSNDDTAAHTVTSLSVPTGAPSFDSGNMPAGATYSFTFTVPGTYTYKCDYHSWMTGTITVVAGSGSTVTTTSSARSSTTTTSSTSASSTTSASRSSAAPANGVAISMPSGAGSGPSAAPGYAPDIITVVIGVNATVTWSNDDTAAHTVTADNMTAGVPVFDSGNMAPGATFTYTFTAPGTYVYHCTYHSWMTGTIKVVQG